MGERKICLTAAFDGSDFQGWQVQDTGRTIQGVIERALEVMHHHPVRLTGAGRTDSGVHARGQTAHFTTDISSITPERFIPALNGLLPRDVRITDSIEVPSSFHARFDAVSREYRYITRYGTADPTAGRGCLQLRTIPDVGLLNRFARAVVGTHDFTAFSSAGDTSATRVRRVIDASWYACGTEIVFEIRGNAFLWKMVRSLVGTMLELERDSAPVSVMKEILESRDRSRAGTTAPPEGLHLWRVAYA